MLFYERVGKGKEALSKALQKPAWMSQKGLELQRQQKCNVMKELVKERKHFLKALKKPTFEYDVHSKLNEDSPSP